MANCKKYYLITVLSLIYPNTLLLSQTGVPQDNIEALATLLYDRGDYDSCLNFISKYTTEKIPTNEIKLHNLALKCWYHKRDFQKVISYGQSITNHPHLFTDNLQLRLSALLLVNHAYIQLNNFEAARESLKQTEALLKSAPLSKPLKSLLHYSHALLNSYDNNPRAGFHFNEALKNSNGNDAMATDIYLRYVDYLIADHDFPSAKKYLDQAFQTHTQHLKSNRVKLVDLLLTKAYFLLENQNHQESAHLLKEEIRPLLFDNKAPFIRLQAFQFHQLATKSYQELGDIDKAMDHNFKGYHLLKKIFTSNQHSAFGKVYANFGYLYKQLGQEKLATEWFNKSQEIFSSYTSFKFILESLLMENEIAVNKKEHERTIILADSAIAIEIKSKKMTNIGLELMHRKARALYHLSKWAESKQSTLATIKRSRKKYGSKSLRFLEYYSLYMEVFYKSGDYKGGINAFENILPLLQGKHIKEASALFLNYGENLSMSGQYDKAITWVLKGIKLALVDSVGFTGASFPSIHNIQDTRQTSYAYRYLGMLYVKKFYYAGKNIQHLKNALPHFLFAADLENQTRYSHKSQEDELNLEAWKESYMNPLKIAVYNNYMLFEQTREQQYLLQCYETAKRNKAYVLQDKVNQDYSLKFGGIPDTILQMERQLKKEISMLQSEINRTKNLAHKEMAKNRWLFKNKTYDSLIRKMEKNYATYTTLKYDFDTTKLEPIQQKLKPNEAILEYFALPISFNITFLVTPDTIVVHKIPSRHLKNHIDSLQRSLSPEFFMPHPQQAYEMYVKTASQLYKEQVAPMLEALPDLERINKLYIIPDGLFNYIPFEVLLSSPPEKDNLINYQNLAYLIKDYDISYAYSTALLFNKKLNQQKPRFWKKKKSGILAFAPSYPSKITDTVQIATLGKFRDDVTPLKWNQPEVKAISSYFDGSFLYGEEATEKNFDEMVNDYDILHLAMHALVDEEDPMNSKMVFSYVTDSIYDSYLHTFELYNINIEARLAVLSACNTGYGELYGGEGLMSLARAFAYAGCPSIVMSHWQVDDKSTSAIMEHFYRHLAEGKKKDEALRLAKLKYLKGAYPFAQHPFFWNNFVVMGDISPVVKKDENKYLNFWVAGTILLLTLSGFGFWWWRKGR